MSEENNNKQDKQELKEESALLQAYKNLQETSVSKDVYEKKVAELEEKNKIYLDAITQGNKIDVETGDFNLTSEIEKMSGFKGTNLEYWKKMNPIIDHIIKEVPESEIVNIAGAEGLDEMIKTNEYMKAMVDQSNDNPDMFNTLFRQKVLDSNTRMSSQIEKQGGLYAYFESQNK